uniref:Tissue factor pathway inhibitor n=1 Tax=Catharus ustulatus TaxID=91951 RepID=A0A8C3V6W2_CATUS
MTQFENIQLLQGGQTNSVILHLLCTTGAAWPPLKLVNPFCAMKPGVCRGYFTRYFYNKETKSCEAFKYGGCLGNQNNFRTLEECQTVCRDNCKLMFLITLSFYSCIKKCVCFKGILHGEKKGNLGCPEAAIIYI